MCELVGQRESTMELLADQRPKITVSLEDVRHIDVALSQRWQVRFVETKNSLLDVIADMPHGPARTEALKAYKTDQTALRRTGSACDIYEAMVDSEVCGLITSHRRHYLLDSIAVACGVYRQLGLSGPILDVGCHVGIATDVMSDVLTVPCVGIDPVESAIRAGQKRLIERPLVELVCGAIPWQTDRRFEFITAIDSMPRDLVERAIFLKGLGELLTEGGVAMVVSAHWVGADVPALRRQLESAKLGFGFADRVGGYGGMPAEFSVEGCVCLVKLGKKRFPRQVGREIERDWHIFQQYANTPSTLKSEKTQAFQRAYAKWGAS